MLFKQKIYELIRQGKVNLAFRKWERPSVKSGGTLLTPIGQLNILSVDMINYGDISDGEIARAGYQSREEMDNFLRRRNAGELYKIKFELGQPDPRIALRENKFISDVEFSELQNKLDRMDSRGKVRNWTRKILTAIRDDPGQNSRHYSKMLGYEKDWFKLNTRKLKNLGLTVSLVDGYDISPRGKRYLERVGELEA